MVDHQQKAAAFLSSFKSRMGVVIPTVVPTNLSSILSEVDNLDGLIAPFTTEEIEGVVKHMKVDKAPGPDGFNGMFLKKCWHIVKDDFVKLCNEFHAGRVPLQSINGSYKIGRAHV